MPDASLATAVEFQAGGAAGSIFKKDSDCASSVEGKTQIRAIDNPNQSSFPKYDMSRSPQAFLNYRPMRLLASGFLVRGPAPQPSCGYDIRRLKCLRTPSRTFAGNDQGDHTGTDHADGDHGWDDDHALAARGDVHRTGVQDALAPMEGDLGHRQHHQAEHDK